jgi:hypothetical protein
MGHSWSGTKQHLTYGVAWYCTPRTIESRETNGSHPNIYLRMWSAEEDEQSLGFGKGDIVQHRVHAVGLGYGDARRHCGSLWRRVRSGVAQPLP